MFCVFLTNQQQFTPTDYFQRCQRWSQWLSTVAGPSWVCCLPGRRVICPLRKEARWVTYKWRLMCRHWSPKPLQTLLMRSLPLQPIVFLHLQWNHPGFDIWVRKAGEERFLCLLCWFAERLLEKAKVIGSVQQSQNCESLLVNLFWCGLPFWNGRQDHGRRWYPKVTSFSLQ